jgi:hypothetical protein
MLSVDRVKDEKRKVSKRGIVLTGLERRSLLVHGRGSMTSRHNQIPEKLSKSDHSNGLNNTFQPEVFAFFTIHSNESRHCGFQLPAQSSMFLQDPPLKPSAKSVPKVSGITSRMVSKSYFQHCPSLLARD